MSKLAVLWVGAVGWCCAALSACAVGARSAPTRPLDTSPSSAGSPPEIGTIAEQDGAVGTTELRVGASGDYAPFSSRDGAGELRGFDVEIAEQLAADLGVQLRWVPFRWPELKAQVQSGAIDVAMSGVTWQPRRAVLGSMTRAVARGGPCVLGDAAATRVAVNQGGVLEAWARGRFGDRELVTVQDNTSLPALLAAGRAGAIVTDSFELSVFARPGWAVECEPALWRKVYWVAPQRGPELAARIDTWLRENTARLQAAHERWFGERQRLDALTHLADVVARRFAFMPLVAGAKAQRGLPIEDLAREREVLAGVAQSARARRLPEPAVVDLFALQIELSKDVQRRQREPTDLELSEIRPALTAIGEGILEALAEARAERRLAALDARDLELLSPWLTLEDRTRLLASLHAVARAEPSARARD